MSRIVYISAPFFSLHFSSPSPASCERPFICDQLKGAEAVPSMGTVLQQLSLYVMAELYERAEASKDSGSDRNYVENGCVSLRLGQGELRMCINVHLVCKQIT